METWWCCGVEKPITQRCSCGTSYEEPIRKETNDRIEEVR